MLQFIFLKDDILNQIYYNTDKSYHMNPQTTSIMAKKYVSNKNFLAKISGKLN